MPWAAVPCHWIGMYAVVCMYVYGTISQLWVLGVSGYWVPEYSVFSIQYSVFSIQYSVFSMY